MTFDVKSSFLVTFRFSCSNFQVCTTLGAHFVIKHRSYLDAGHCTVTWHLVHSNGHGHGPGSGAQVESEHSIDWDFRQTANIFREKGPEMVPKSSLSEPESDLGRKEFRFGRFRGPSGSRIQIGRILKVIYISLLYSPWGLFPDRFVQHVAFQASQLASQLASWPAS